MPAVPAAAWAIRALMRGALLAAALLSPAAAQSDAAADTAIRTALTQWAADFNARRADKVCELFAPDLVAQFRGQPENDYRGLCDQLRRSLSDPAKTYSYALTIKEILVFGEVAIVRLVWTLTVERKEPPGKAITDEPGLDIFRRQPDGKWKIIRFTAYDLPP